MIPKVIHYCWFGGKPIPNDVKKCINSWKKKCPDYEIKCWNESNFDVNAHPFTKAAYEAKAWAFVSDYARLKVVYDHGGIYLDTDVELLKNLDFLLKYDFYIGIQQVGHLCMTGLGFGAQKFNSIVLEMLNKYDSVNFSIDNKNQIACPYLNNEVIKQLGYIYDSEKCTRIKNNLILPEKYMDPIAPGEGLENLKCKDTISIHHYSASWMGSRIKIKRKIIRKIGQENVSIMKHIFSEILKRGV